MSVEVEVKARLRNPDETIARLRERATGEPSVYLDTYYDWPDQRLERNGRQELRLRVIETAGQSRTVLTFKGAMIDAASTPEHETTVGDADVASTILSSLGLERAIQYTKQCENFRFEVAGRLIVATAVRIPEIDGVFLEVETLIPKDEERGPAFQAILSILADLGLGDADLEPTFYIDMVRGTRAVRP